MNTNAVSFPSTVSVIKVEGVSSCDFRTSPRSFCTLFGLESADEDFTKSVRTYVSRRRLMNGLFDSR